MKGWWRWRADKPGPPYRVFQIEVVPLAQTTPLRTSRDGAPARILRHGCHGRLNTIVQEPILHKGDSFIKVESCRLAEFIAWLRRQATPQQSRAPRKKIAH